MPPQIFVDADACPVKEEAIRVAVRYGLELILVSNQGMRPVAAAKVRQVVVSAKFDAADDWIVEHARAGDMVITADIQLAGRCVKMGCKALSPAGHEFTAQNIGDALAMRELHAYLREAGEIKSHHAVFSKQNRSRFLQSLDAMIQKSR